MSKFKRKFTKGKWIADGNGFSPTWDISNDQHSIAEVKTSRADADLIAAAPELLEALKGLSGDIMSLDPNDRAKRFVTALAAIAKAEGRAK